MLSKLGVFKHDVGVVCEYAVEFGVDSDEVSSDFEVQILLILFDFGHFCITTGLLFSSVKILFSNSSFSG